MTDSQLSDVQYIQHKMPADFIERLNVWRNLVDVCGADTADAHYWHGLYEEEALNRILGQWAMWED